MDRAQCACTQLEGNEHTHGYSLIAHARLEAHCACTWLEALHQDGRDYAHDVDPSVDEEEGGDGHGTQGI